MVCWHSLGGSSPIRSSRVTQLMNSHQTLREQMCAHWVMCVLDLVSAVKGTCHGVSVSEGIGNNQFSALVSGDHESDRISQNLMSLSLT